MFIRSRKNPIVRPNLAHDWESKKVYNPGCIFNNGKYHLFYRAVGKDGISSIGYAVSNDGENFTAKAEPLLRPQGSLETKGIEDPRISLTADKFYLTYTAYDGDCARLCSAISSDLKNWRKQGVMIKDWNFIKAGGFLVKWDEARNKFPVRTQWSKAGGIFSEAIGGYYWMLFGDSNLWLAKSKDGISWEASNQPLLMPRKGFFDSEHLEMGPPPIKTSQGWLVLYHGIDETMTYRLGLILLDLNQPARIIFRTSRPIFAPTAKYELTGIIDIAHNNKPKVIFCCGAALREKLLRIYYGAGDSIICQAIAGIEDLLNLSNI